MPHTPAWTRREFLRATAAGAFAAGSGLWTPLAFSQDKGDRPAQAEGVKVVNPRGRVPVSLIIDDSTCLVNLAHYCIPHFAEAFPDRYRQDWKSLPREIPDVFVRKFGEWCREHGVKGKYSVIPYPACVGWIDRDMPGWSRQELLESVALVRDFMMADWDIHPEMVTHTWAIDTKTGRPFAERTERYLENWGWSVGMSVDQMADYVGFALRILKNVGLDCEGVTTPGGFGSQARPSLAAGTMQAVRDVFGAEVPHYFRDLYTDQRSVAPQVYYASGLDADDPKCVVSIIGCTGDWFGGWDGLERGSVDRFITADLQQGRLVDVINRQEPAIMVCHWPGIYFNGDEVGFNIFKAIVQRLNARYDNLAWMKLSEIARYWAAKELTRIEHAGGNVTLRGPFACPDFTVDVSIPAGHRPVVTAGEQLVELAEAKRRIDLQPGTFVREGERAVVCFDLPQRRDVRITSQTAQ
jgi:hypothetical protein